jgi:hypothetical protein
MWKFCFQDVLKLCCIVSLLIVVASSEIGRVNLNSESTPSSLSTHISPLFIVINSLHNISPKPVPDSLLVPGVDTYSSILNNLLSDFCDIPTPKS